MPIARRVMFGTYVVPSKSDTMEEDSISKTSFLGATSNDILSKTLGGKGNAIIDATQWNDAWTSMFHSQVNWEDLDDSNDITGNRWEDTHKIWSGNLSATTTINLTDDGSDLGFLYIKNTSPSIVCEVSINGTSGDYFIKIPSNGSVHLRGGNTSFNCNMVYVRGLDGEETSIEYIIAQITP
mgnify:CR=1 FL=1|tara:strand:- start:1660 stop:2205 length:546 start_codon:yes stop_codon:yes gene_type:complete